MPDGCVVGEPGDGWRVARSTLATERVAMGRGSALGDAVEGLISAVRLGRARRRSWAGGAARGARGRRPGRVADGPAGHAGAAARGGAGAEAAVRKLVGVAHRQSVAETALTLCGPDGAAGRRRRGGRGPRVPAHQVPEHRRRHDPDPAVHGGRTRARPAQGAETRLSWTSPVARPSRRSPAWPPGSWARPQATAAASRSGPAGGQPAGPPDRRPGAGQPGTGQPYDPGALEGTRPGRAAGPGPAGVAGRGRPRGDGHRGPADRDRPGGRRRSPRWPRSALGVLPVVRWGDRGTCSNPCWPGSPRATACSRPRCASRPTRCRARTGHHGPAETAGRHRLGDQDRRALRRGGGPDPGASQHRRGRHRRRGHRPVRGRGDAAAHAQLRWPARVHAAAGRGAHRGMSSAAGRTAAPWRTSTSSRWPGRAAWPTAPWPPRWR